MWNCYYILTQCRQHCVFFMLMISFNNLEDQLLRDMNVTAMSFFIFLAKRDIPGNSMSYKADQTSPGKLYLILRV